MGKKWDCNQKKTQNHMYVSGESKGKMNRIKQRLVGGVAGRKAIENNHTSGTAEGLTIASLHHWKVTMNNPDRSAWQAPNGMLYSQHSEEEERGSGNSEQV